MASFIFINLPTWIDIVTIEDKCSLKDGILLNITLGEFEMITYFQQILLDDFTSALDIQETPYVSFLTKGSQRNKLSHERKP